MCGGKLAGGEGNVHTIFLSSVLTITKTCQMRMHANAHILHKDIADLKIACEGAPAILDVNGDGKVTMSEICAKLDANEDGTITLKEFTDAFGTLLALEEAAVVDGGDPNVHKLFDAMDTDKDGIVDKIEFLEFIRLHKPKLVTAVIPKKPNQTKQTSACLHVAVLARWL